MNLLYKVYALIFARNIFLKLNKLLYLLSLRGLGILNYKNSHLSGERGFLIKYLNRLESPTIIDVGANKGSYTVDVLNANKSSRVFCFEPHPKTFQKLNKLFANEKNVLAVNTGVGDQNSILKLFDYENGGGSSHASLYKDVLTDLHKSKGVSTNDINIIRLDEFIEEKKIQKIDLLKIDTEGNEYACLQGLGSYLKGDFVKAIHFEFNEMNAISGIHFKMFWDLLSLDYDLFRLLPGGSLLQIKEYSPVYCEIYAYQNIVAINK
jgi:FkbM family methyltransferase